MCGYNPTRAVPAVCQLKISFMVQCSKSAGLPVCLGGLLFQTPQTRAFESVNAPDKEQIAVQGAGGPHLSLSQHSQLRAAPSSSPLCCPKEQEELRLCCRRCCDRVSCAALQQSSAGAVASWGLSSSSHVPTGPCWRLSCLWLRTASAVTDASRDQMHGFRNTQHESLQLGELAEDNAASDGKKGYLPRWPTQQGLATSGVSCRRNSRKMGRSIVALRLVWLHSPQQCCCLRKAAPSHNVPVDAAGALWRCCWQRAAAGFSPKVAATGL